MGKVKVDFITDTNVISLTGLHRGCSPKIWPQSFICLSYCSLLHGREEMGSSLMLLLWLFFFFTFIIIIIYSQTMISTFSFFLSLAYVVSSITVWWGTRGRNQSQVVTSRPRLNCLNPKEAKLDSTLRGRELPFVTGWISCSVSGMPE